MFIGCQFSLYPMTNVFVPVILEAVQGLGRFGLPQRSSDDLSTFLLGPPDRLLEALAATWAGATAGGHHVVMNVTLSRGCPGEPEAACCHTDRNQQVPLDSTQSFLEIPHQGAIQRIHTAASKGVSVETHGQYSVYPLGDTAYMERILTEIQAAKDEGVYDGAKHFMSRLKGSPGDVFAYLYRAFLRAAPMEGHLVIQATLSANSPSGHLT